MVASATGREQVLAALASPRFPGLFTDAQWSGPVASDAAVEMRAELSPGRVYGAVTLVVARDDEGAITEVLQEVVPAPPPLAAPVVLTEDVKAVIGGALANGTPVVVAYVDADGAPHVSLRGSVQAFGDDRLAIWVRDPAGGLPRAIPGNPRVALFYRDPTTRTTLQFAGRARIDDDPAVRDVVYTTTPELERDTDPRRRGVAVVVELDSVTGVTPGGRFRMERRVG
jgi:hypothetical protein